VPAPSIVDRVAQRRLAPLLALAVGCHSWQSEFLPRTGPAPRAVPGRLRATRTDGSRVELTRARLASDTLHGELRAVADGAAARAVAIPVDSVRALDRRRFSIARSFGLFFALSAVGYLSTALVGGGEEGAGARR
jgi:hypothetical protein